MQFIDLKEQYRRYSDEIQAPTGTISAHGHHSMGPEVPELEDALAGYVEVDDCVSVATGTDSLDIALRARGEGPDAETVTVPFTWISTAEVIRLEGAKPVFVDIEAPRISPDLNFSRSTCSVAGPRPFPTLRLPGRWAVGSPDLTLVISDCSHPGGNMPPTLTRHSSSTMDRRWRSEFSCVSQR